jgi:hypothetical protein
MASMLQQPIFRRYNTCVQAFEKLITHRRHNIDPLDCKDDVSDLLEDDYGKFRVWAGNTGAHRLGRVSLDYRLRESSHMSSKVLAILANLEDDLEESRIILSSTARL